MRDQTLIFKKLDISLVTLSDDCGKTHSRSSDEENDYKTAVAFEV